MLFSAFTRESKLTKTMHEKKLHWYINKNEIASNDSQVTLVSRNHSYLTEPGEPQDLPRRSEPHRTTHLNEGIGYACAWHWRVKLVPAALTLVRETSSPGNFGPDRPTGSGRMATRHLGYKTTT